jgi:hypothetical protein
MTSRQQKHNIIPTYNDNDRDHLPSPIDDHQFTQQQSSSLFTQEVVAAANVTTTTDDGEKMSVLPLTQIVANTTTTVTNPEDARSISSYSTFGQKDPKNSLNNKRNARKSPTGDQEPDPRRLLLLPQSSLPLISSSSSSASSNTLLLLGAPPGFSSFGTTNDGPLTLSDTGNDRKLVADDASTVQIFNRAVGSSGGGFSFPDQPQQQQEQMQPLFLPRLGQQQQPQHHQQFIYPQDFIDMPSIISTFSSLTQEDNNNRNVSSYPRTTATTATNNITTTYPNIVPNNSSNLSMDGSTRCSPINTKLSRGGNPRSILNERYQKKYNYSFTKSDFISIKDTSNGDHVPQFTSVFVCPESGECFMSGELSISSGGIGSSSGDFDISKNDEINWYATKKTAEFAAAGRAEDNFYFRSSCSSAEHLSHSSGSSTNGIQQQFFCKESPYYIAIDDEPNINISLSSFLQEKFWDNGSTKEKVDKLILKARRRDGRSG